MEEKSNTDTFLELADTPETYLDEDQLRRYRKEEERVKRAQVPILRLLKSKNIQIAKYRLRMKRKLYAIQNAVPFQYVDVSVYWFWLFFLTFGRPGD